MIDSKTGKPVEAASVQLFLADNDSIVSGMLSKPNGDFSFSEIPAGKKLKVVITAIGYEPMEQVIEMSGGKQNRNIKVDKDLGNIKLEANVQVLGALPTGMALNLYCSINWEKILILHLLSICNTGQ